MENNQNKNKKKNRKRLDITKNDYKIKDLFINILMFILNFAIILNHTLF